MQKTKWVDHNLNKQERDAQKIWRRAESQQSKIVEALKSCDHYMSREDMHKRLDRRLDAIDKMRDRAVDMFPEVDESFTMFCTTIPL